ncbi:MAG: Tetracycline resistance protein, class C [Chlamydiales bacterium]|nr:Tetracycline resistance protein, class C [Chlamydiales bacterium]
MPPRKLPLGILLLSGFIDYAGIAIVYPILAYLLFDPTFHFLSPETSSGMRGLWLGILIALHPFFQFLFAPILGSLSDLRGRKRLLILSFWIGLASYALAMLGIYFQSITLLVIYRITAGIACSNCSIVSAIVADISTAEQKARNYGLLNMAFGAGFTFGPFISGVLARSAGLITPFAVAFALVVLNLVLVWWKLDETRTIRTQGKVKVLTAFYQVKQAAQMPELRFVFLSLLFFSFGWSFFTEFIPLFLIERYDFSPIQTGFFYGYSGAFYSLSAGFFIYPFIRLMGIQKTLFYSMLLAGLYLFLFLGIRNVHFIWLYIPLVQFFLAFAYPATAALISNRVSDERQGEAMGIYESLIALALAITPFFSGSFVGRYPALTVIVSGIFMALSAAIILLQKEAPVSDVDEVG